MLPLSHHPLFSHGLLSMNHSVAVGTSVAWEQRSLMWWMLLSVIANSPMQAYTSVDQTPE